MRVSPISGVAWSRAFDLMLLASDQELTGLELSNGPTDENLWARLVHRKRTRVSRQQT